MFNVVFIPKVTSSDCFLIIFLFILKKVPGNSNYSIFKCFIFFQSGKICCIFNCGVIYLFFCSKKIFYIFHCDVIIFVVSLKRFLTSLIMFSLIPFFLSFSSLELFISICCRNYVNHNKVDLIYFYVF